MRVILTLKARPMRYRVEDDLYDNGTWAGTPARTRTLLGAMWMAFRSRRFTTKATRIVKEVPR